METIKETIELLTGAKIQFSENEDLSNHSTMKTIAFAAIFITIDNTNDLKKILQIIGKTQIKFQIIGSGSNTLFTGDFEGLILKVDIRGIKTINENDESALIEVGAGESWHEFVKYCVDLNLAGNENLAYIPGTVGAAPVQNIAAYGQVQEDTFESLEAIDIKTGEVKVFNKKECQFAYRTSIFKKQAPRNKHQGRFLIISVCYRVFKVEEYIPETSYHSRYESLQDELKIVAGNGPYTLKDVFNTVISLRKKKLPEWQDGEEGTLGSFFLNPFITKQELAELQLKFPKIQYYPVDKMQYPGLEDEGLKMSDLVKVPAGWILEELGWRGKFIGNVGCSNKHALCVVTKGRVEGKEVKEFIRILREDVFKKTKIKLQPEINIL